MVYQEKFVVVVKDALGRVLREVQGDGEAKDTVVLPFGSEYIVYFKNLGTSRAVVKLSIDGTDALGGNELVIDPGSDFDLNGALENGVVRYRFKTAQKTADVVAQRGDSVEHGLIQVEFRFELPVRREPEVSLAYMGKASYGPLYRTSVGGRGAGGQSASRGCDPSPNTIDYSPVSASAGPIPNADEVVTVAGSETYQGFSRTRVGALGDPHKIIIRLRGDVDGVPVTAPASVKASVRCTNCGATSPFGTNFCPKCGNNLRSMRPLA